MCDVPKCVISLISRSRISIPNECPCKLLHILLYRTSSRGARKMRKSNTNSLQEHSNETGNHGTEAQLLSSSCASEGWSSCGWGRTGSSGSAGGEGLRWVWGDWNRRSWSVRSDWHNGGAVDWESNNGWCSDWVGGASGDDGSGSWAYHRSVKAMN